MKIIAIILIFSFSAFLTETLVFPNKHITVSQTNVHPCCGQCKMAQAIKNESKKTEKNKCNQACANCPVFAIFYPGKIDNSILILPELKSKYLPVEDACISNYLTATWKPPAV